MVYIQETAIEALFLKSYISNTDKSQFKKLRVKKESRFKKDFLMPNVRFKKDFFPKSGKNRDFLAILEQFLGFFQLLA